METLLKSRSERVGSGFTLFELLVVIVVLAIAAMLAVPMLSSSADIQVGSAANMISSDLEYTQNMAVSRQQNYSIVFSVANDSYEVRDSSGNVIDYPARAGTAFAVSFPDDSRLRRVDITAANFDSAQTVTFDYLGSPYNESATPLNSGQITLQADTCTMIVTVAPVTGYVSISSP